MRKLIVAEQISLDGVIQSPGAPKEDPSAEFRLGGWIVPYADEAIGHALQDLFSQPFELLLGRRTYEIFAAYWPHVRADSANHAIADLFNSVPKHVATHRSDTLDWQNSHALKGDLADAIRALKHQGGINLLRWGSGDMVHQLLATGLVDELRLLIYPVVLWARQALVRRQRTGVGLHPGEFEQHAWRCADHPLCAQRRGAHRNVRRSRVGKASDVHEHGRRTDCAEAGAIRDSTGLSLS
jgi:dihydrofolate reductase